MEYSYEKIMELAADIARTEGFDGQGTDLKVVIGNPTGSMFDNPSSLKEKTDIGRKEMIEKLLSLVEYNRLHRNELLIKRLEGMVPFDDEHIPSPPVVDKETYDKYVIPNFVRCGAIPSSELIVGKKYYGHCRNADVAVWLGDKFEYERTKFGSSYRERINNFDNDNGYDLFVPIRLSE